MIPEQGSPAAEKCEKKLCFHITLSPVYSVPVARRKGLANFSLMIQNWLDPGSSIGLVAFLYFLIKPSFLPLFSFSYFVRYLPSRFVSCDVSQDGIERTDFCKSFQSWKTRGRRSGSWRKRSWSKLAGASSASSDSRWAMVILSLLQWRKCWACYRNVVTFFDAS